MKKELIFGIFLLSFLVSLSLVMAAGSSTGSNSNTNSNSNITANTTPVLVNCETRATVQDRIGCRLQNRTAINSIEEACRNLDVANRTACVNFQKRAGPCYDLPAREKAMCMRQNAGLGAGQLNRFAAEDRRKYAALLMYELQERIEASNEAGRLTDEEASGLIAQIVDIKESLLSNSPIEDARSKMVTFKQDYLGAMNG